MEIPLMVRLHGKISPAWKAYDLELLHKMSRCGSSLGAIANSLPCLWYFQQKLREPILKLFIENDNRIGRCCHQNLGTGERSELAECGTDVVVTDDEIEQFPAIFSDLCDALLSLPKRDCQEVLEAVAYAIQSVKTHNEIKARTLNCRKTAKPPNPRKRRETVKKA